MNLLVASKCSGAACSRLADLLYTAYVTKTNITEAEEVVFASGAAEEGEKAKIIPPRPLHLNLEDFSIYIAL